MRIAVPRFEAKTTDRPEWEQILNGSWTAPQEMEKEHDHAHNQKDVNEPRAHMKRQKPK